MTQYARPIADLSTGAWTTTPLWSKLNETSYDDGTEISLNNQTANACDIDLGTVTDPVSSTGHILRIRAHKTGSGTINCTAVLYCGATSIRSNGLTLGTGYAETTITLTAGEADAITDYSNLHVTLTGTCAASSRYVYVSWMVLDVPDASQNITETASAARSAGVTVADQVSVIDATSTARSDGITALTQTNEQDGAAQAKYAGVGAVEILVVEETLYGA